MSFFFILSPFFSEKSKKINLKPLFSTQKTYQQMSVSKKKDKGDKSARNYELDFADIKNSVLHINSSSFM